MVAYLLCYFDLADVAGLRANTLRNLRTILRPHNVAGIQFESIEPRADFLRNPGSLE